MSRKLKTENEASFYIIIHSTPASVAIAWLIARRAVSAPIASATTLEQLNSLVDAAQLELSDDAIGKLNKASDWK